MTGVQTCALPIFAGAAVNLRRSLLTDNAVALHAQSGTVLGAAETLPDAPVDGEFLVSNDTLLLRNLVRTGTGLVPLPPPVPRP